MATSGETAAMRRAVALAAQGIGRTSPNPVVGCVIIDAAGVVIGEGFHECAGGPHAEIAALRSAGPRARGATAVVTLEPCNHMGRTPPCSNALAEAGVARVVVAVRDPYRPAAGGLRTLLAAGVDVEVGVLAEEAERVNEAWLTSVRLDRPHVTWKYAASLDGRVAAADGSSRWVTGSAARADAHRLRAEADAVLVGSGTVLADDPHLAVRKAALRRAQPLRVVVDTLARTPVTSRVLDGAAPTLVAVADDADAAVAARAARLAEAGAQILRAPRSRTGRGLDLDALLVALRKREVVSVLLEGGPTLAGGFLARGLIDRVVAYVAPVLIGDGGRAALAGAGAPSMDAARRLRIDDVAVIGSDVRITARPTGRAEED